MKNTNISLPSLQNRILIRLLCSLILFGQLSPLIAEAQAVSSAASSSASSVPFSLSVKDQSVIGREAQQFSKTLGTPDLGVSNGSFNLGIKDKNNNVKTISTPIDYKSLTGKPQSSETTTDQEKLWNDSNGLDSEGGKTQNQLYQDATSGNPATTEGGAYQVAMKTRTMTKPNMQHDAMFNTTRDVRKNIDVIAQNFADCKDTVSYVDKEQSTKLSEAKSCTKIYDKSETCNIKHNFTVGLIAPVSGDVQAEHPSSSQMVIKLGQIGDDYLKAGNNCVAFSSMGTWRVDNPQAITRVTLSRAYYDDYMAVSINGSNVWGGPLPAASNKKCERGTTWDEHPGTDLTSLFKGTPEGGNLTFAYNVMVGGEGEAEAEITIDYDRSKLVRKEYYTPDSCIEHWKAAKNGFATIKYSCTDSLDGSNQSGEYKGGEKGNDSHSSAGNNLCSSNDYEYTCPTDASNPWTLGADGTCYRQETKEAPPTTQDTNGCADPNYTYNVVNGMCEYKDNLVTLDYSPVAKISCPTNWVLDVPTNTCVADVLKTKIAIQAENKGCTDSSYLYDAATDSCYQLGYDPKTYQATEIYKCPTDATNPWTLVGKQCHRAIADTKEVFDNSFYACADKTYKYDATLGQCTKTVLSHQPYPVTPTYSCPVDNADPWTLNYNKCQRYVRDTVPPSSYGTCTSLYTLDSSGPQPVCVRMVQQTSFALTNPTDVCPTGWTDNHTDCQQASVAKINPYIEESLSCPSGYKVDKSGSTPACVGIKQEWQDATKVTSFYCGSGEVMDSNTQTCVSSSGSTSTTPLVDYQCPVDPINPWTLIAGKCQRVLETKVQANETPAVSCPSGFSWDTTYNSCVKVDITSVPYSSTYSTVCPNDPSNPWSYDSASGQCKRHLVLTEPANHIIVKNCNDNTYTYNNLTDQCEKTVIQTAAVIPAIYTCPVDNANPWTLSGQSCTRSVTSTLTAKAVPVLTCSTGYTLQGNTCVKVTVANQPATQVTYCPVGFVQSGANCIKYAPTAAYSNTMSCPGGFTLKAGTANTCFLNQTLPATAALGCPSGFTLSGSTCSKTVNDSKPANEAYNCQQGYLWNGTACAKTTTNTVAANTSYVCPNGYQTMGTGPTTTCEKVDSVQPTTKCPIGYTVNGTACEKTTTADAQRRTLVCPMTITKGTDNYFSIGVANDGNCNYANSQTCNPQNTECIQNVTQAPKNTVGYFGTASNYSEQGYAVYDSNFVYVPGTCPSGFTYAGGTATNTFWQAGTCQKIEQGTPTLNCGTGWTLNGQTCNKTLTATPTQTYSCGQNYVLSGNTCYEVTNVTSPSTTTYSCESGWTLAGSTCNYSANTSFNATVTLTCTKGTLSGTNCLITDQQPAGQNNSCPQGYTNGSTCEKTTITAATVSSYTCPQGYTLNGATCSKTTVNTTATTLVYNCPSGWVINGTVCSLTTTDSQSANVYYSCPSGWTLSGNNCSLQTVDTQPATSGQTCPNGYALQSGSCVQNSTVPASTQYLCPNGWSNDPQNAAQCRQAYNVYANPYTTNNNCYTIYPQLGYYGTLMGINNGQCKYHVIPPGPQPYDEWHSIQSNTSSKYACPNGLTCYSSSLVWSAEPCDPGYTYTGGLYYTSNSCQKVAYNYQPGTLNYYCTAGNLSGNSCNITSTVAPTTTYSCSSGYTLSGNTCTKNITQNQVATSNTSCPSGYQLNGNNCEKTTTQTQAATSAIACPSGWVLNGAQTQCTLTTVDNQAGTPVYSCAVGVVNGSNCVDTASQNATVAASCPPGWTDTGTGCQSGTDQFQPVSIDYTCAPGYIYMGGSSCAQTTTTTVPALSNSSTYSCDPGYNLDTSVTPNLCRKTDSQTIAAFQQVPASCPGGYTLDGNTCSQSSKLTGGYTIASDTWQCTSGYVLDNATKTCTFDKGPESTPPSNVSSNFCPNGYTDSGYDCQMFVYYFDSTIPKPAVYSCPSSYTLDQSVVPAMCTLSNTEIQNPTIVNLATCPIGWVNTGNRCYMGTPPVMPASVISIGYSCDVGWNLDTTQTIPQCTIIEHKVRQPISQQANTCPQGWTDIGTRCEQFDLVSQNPILIKNALLCPSGYTLNGTKCEKVTKLNTPADRVCKSNPSSSSSSEDLSIFNALTKTTLNKQAISHSSSSAPAPQQQTFVATSKKKTLTKESLAHYISKVTSTPPLGGDGVDNCITDSATGTYVCESNFGSSPIPEDAVLSPFCKNIEVKIDYDYYKGKFTFIDANGQTVEMEAGLNKNDNCDALEKDSTCSFRTTRCVEGFEDIDGRCYQEEHVYDCGSTVSYNDVEAKKDRSCNGAVRCMGSDCLDPAEEKSPSFQKAAALMNAAQMMTTDMSCDIVTNGVSDCKVFTGKKYACKVAVGGAQDCCNVPTGVSAGDYLSAVMAMYKANKAMMAVQNPGTAVGAYQTMANGVAESFSAVTKPFASSIENVSGAVENFVSPVKEVIDNLKDQISKFLEDTLNKLFTKTSTDIAANTATSGATQATTDQASKKASSEILKKLSSGANVLMTAYTVYCTAMLVIQTIYKCEQEEFELAPKKETKNCTYIGQKKVSLLEKQFVYCCYNSPLSRIVNEQASLQLGTPLKDQSPSNPNCSGLTVSDMTKLDWEKMDLSEWIGLLQQYNLGTQMTASEMNEDRLTGSGSVYNQMFPDSQRQNVTDRTKSRMDDLDFEEITKKAKEQAPGKVDGCSTCK